MTTMTTDRKTIAASHRSGGLWLSREPSEGLEVEHKRKPAVVTRLAGWWAVVSPDGSLLGWVTANAAR